MNKKMISIIGILVVLVVAGFFLSNRGQETDAGPGDQSDDNQEVSVPSDWEAYENSAVGVGVQAPSSADVSEEAGRLKVQVLGPEAEANTEVTDGFTFFARPLDIPEGSTLESFAQNQYEQESEGPGEGVTAPQATSTAGYDAYVFTTESGLGSNVTHQLIQVDSDTAIEASYTIAAPEGADRDYRATIETMLETLELVNRDTEQSAETQTIEIALLDYKGTGEESTGKERGCDRVVMVEREIEATQAPLSAALNELFSLDSETVDGWNNFIAKTNDTLSFDRVTISDGTASVYLSGELSGLAGACDNPRAQIQIEETALQFSTVDEVQLYLNGEETDLSPSGQ